MQPWCLIPLLFCKNYIHTSPQPIYIMKKALTLVGVIYFSVGGAYIFILILQ